MQLKPQKLKMKFHVDQSGNSYVNFLYILREIEIPISLVKTY